MRNVTEVLRQLFGSKTSSDHNSYLTWAKTEYGSDWRFAYDHMVRTSGERPPQSNNNLRGWV